MITHIYESLVMKKKTQYEFENDVKRVNPYISIMGDYINNATRVRVNCTKCGRVWDAMPTTITVLYKCPLCEKQEKFGEFLVGHKLKTLDPYKDNFTKLRIGCTLCGHIWKAVPKTLKRDYRCPKCYDKGKRIKWTNTKFFEEIKNKAPNVVLLENYKGYEVKIHCSCKVCSRDFWKSPHQLLGGKGCPNCNGYHVWTEDEYKEKMHEINHNIEISGFTRIKNRVSSKCLICGCEWSPQAYDLLKGHGCPRCAGRERLDFDRFVSNFISVNDSIEILAEDIPDTKTMFNCRCKRCGNIWKTNVNRLRQGNGCNLCNHSATSFMEQAILKAFRSRLGEKEVRSRCKTVIGKELDIFIPSKSIAFEPGGWFFHRKSFKKDTQKRQLCYEKGIRLITIFDNYKESEPPYKDNCIVYEEELGAPKNRDILRNLIDKLFLICNVSPNLDDMEWDSVQQFANEKSMHKSSEEIIREIREANNKIELLEKPTRVHERINCKCLICGWIWKTSPIKIKSGVGCPECAGTRKLSQKEFDEQLHETNPQVVALDLYENITRAMRFQCRECGYEWKRSPRAMIRSGSGCPVCRKKDRLISVLEKRGVKLSKEDRNCIIDFARENPDSKYKTQEFHWMIDKINPTVEVIGNYTKIDENILCKCKICGYIWEPRAQHILNGHGCPICRKRVES